MDKRMMTQEQNTPARLSRRLSFFSRATTWLMFALVLWFVWQQIVVVHMEKPYDAYLGLSGYGMKSGHLWELFTFQFLHINIVHLLVSLVGLWFLGRPLESRFGRKQFCIIFFATATVGAILQGLFGVAGFIIPESSEHIAAPLRDKFGGPIMGATVGLCGVLVVLCRLHPEKKLGPLPLRMSHLIWLAILIAIILVAIPTDPRFPALAQLGALLAGLVMPKPTPRLHAP